MVYYGDNRIVDEAQLITILLSLVATLFGLLVLISGWMGNKVYQKLSEMANTMHSIEVDLHGKISNLDRRVTIIETVMHKNSCEE
jgi:hypothetical protein